MEIEITEAPASARKPRPNETDLGFGRYTTDHMFMMDYDRRAGWHRPRIEPYQDLRLDPIAMVLHYNQQVFDGLKAYALDDGGVGLFRPQKYAQRLNGSARRMVMPEVNPELFVEALRHLVLLDRDWIPRSKGTALYIRPTMIATEPALGVRPSDRYLFYIVAGPVGAYYREGFSPTRIFVAESHVRAALGGVGEAKTSGNYAPTLLVSQEASRSGYTQVLWLDAKENRYVEEVGTSNIFFRMGDELVTPPLGGTILPGVTRDSVIALARHWGMTVRERRVAIEEVMGACRSGALTEMFATGTAAVISPVGRFRYRDDELRVADGETGTLSVKLYDAITDIQYGRKEDPFGWLLRVE